MVFCDVNVIRVVYLVYVKMVQNELLLYDLRTYRQNGFQTYAPSGKAFVSSQNVVGFKSFYSILLDQVRRRLVHVCVRLDRWHRLQGQNRLPARQKSQIANLGKNFFIFVSEVSSGANFINIL